MPPSSMRRRTATPLLIDFNYDTEPLAGHYPGRVDLLAWPPAWPRHTRHRRRHATRRHGLPVLEWGVAPDVAAKLNAELGTSFAPFDGVDVVVDRSAQLAAIDCHASQARDNPVMVRRLQPQGAFERIGLASSAPVPAQAVLSMTARLA